jgi:hypothetical protein
MFNIQIMRIIGQLRLILMDMGHRLMTYSTQLIPKMISNMLVQLKEVTEDYKHVSLSGILKEKQCIVTRIEDFDIDCVLDEETHVNIMPESTWEILGNPSMIPSFGRIGLFKGKMITLCGRVTNRPMVAHETSTEEDFEVIRFVENNAPFPLLLGNT